MDLSGEKLLLAPDVHSQHDGLIKQGIHYGLLVKGWQGSALSPTEDAVAAKLKPVEGTQKRNGVSFNHTEAEAALAALKRGEEFLRRTDSFGDNDLVAWRAIPEIEAFVARTGRVAIS